MLLPSSILSTALIWRLTDQWQNDEWVPAYKLNLQKWPKAPMPGLQNRAGLYRHL